MKLAVIGTKFISELFIQAAAATGLYEPYIICSRSRERGESFAARFGFEKTVRSIDEAAADPLTDVVYIATPNTLHYEHARLCLLAGKHVIVEKPSFVNLGQLAELLKLAEERGLFLFEAMRSIHNPNYEIVKSRLKDIAPVRYAHFTLMRDFTGQRFPGRTDEPPVFLPDFAGGCNYHLGIYGISAALYFFGRPESVGYFPVMLPTGVDGTGVCVLRYPAMVCIVTSSIVTVGELPDEIQGENGAVTMDYVVTPRSAELHRAGETLKLPLAPADDDMRFEAGDFARIIAQNDTAAYAEIKAMMSASLEILQECRRQAGIRFHGDE